MGIIGEKVVLRHLTIESCHEMFKEYVPDPMMTEEPYEYSKEKVDKYFNERTGDTSRRVFSIEAEGRVIGEVQVKYINNIIKKGNVGILLSNDSYKGKGYGTEAERLIIQYAFKELGLNTLYADSVLRNTRSQHIMEKLGFKYVYEDDTFKYYELKK